MIVNFSAGPGILPPPVIQTIKEEFDNFCDTGSSIIEISHRSEQFMRTISDASSDIKSLMNIPDDYEILFMQGGATAQFSAILYNLLLKDQHVDYCITGAWSQKAYDESQRLGVNGNIVFHSKGKGDIPSVSAMNFSVNPAFIYYCDNETIHGVEMPSDFSDQIRSKVGDVPIVCDMSSNILSRPINVSNFGLIFAGAQKNLGAAGVTIVIIRKDLIVDMPARIPPISLDYKTFSKSQSLYNTPPTFSIYVTSLVLKWIKDKGLAEIYASNEEKARLLYTFIKESKIYKCPVQEEYQSRMNVPFRIWINDKVHEASESDFLSLCESSNLVGLSGHRSVGGIRASLYNAMTLSGVETLIKIMKEFEESVTKSKMII